MERIKKVIFFIFKKLHSFYLKGRTLKILLCISTFFFFFLSWAKFHIEPYVGLSATYTNSRPLIQKSSEAVQFLKEGRYYAGLTPGMRLGYSSLGLAVGLDMSVSHLRSLYKENFQAFKNQETLNFYLPGLFVSYKFPLLLRAYATLIPQAITQLKSHKEEKNLYCKQSRGVKLGISYLSLPFLSVNLEYLPLYMGGTNCRSWSHTGTVYANFTF